MHCFGKEGTQPGELKRPYGIALDGDGMVYVADYWNNRVQKLTPEGKVLAVINTKGKGDRLNQPVGLCVDNNDILYVVDYGSSTVCMYNTGVVESFLGTLATVMARVSRALGLSCPTSVINTLVVTME